MRRSRRLSVGVALAVAASLALVAAPPAQASPAPKPDGPKKVVTAYFADWNVYGRGYYVKDIPVTKLNVIQYAFGVPGYDEATGAASCDVLDPWADYQQVYWSGDNTVDGVADDPSNPDQHLFGSFNQLRKLKAANPHLKVQISLGGWTKSTWFSTLASTPELRTAFVASCIDTFIKGNLPGRRLARGRGRRGCGGRGVRRHRPRLGVPDAGGRRQRQPRPGRPAQRDAAGRRVPQAARRVRRHDRQALPAHRGAARRPPARPSTSS